MAFFPGRCLCIVVYNSTVGGDVGLRTYVLHECENNACYIPYATMGKKNNRLSRVFWLVVFVFVFFFHRI